MVGQLRAAVQTRVRPVRLRRQVELEELAERFRAAMVPVLAHLLADLQRSGEASAECVPAHSRPIRSKRGRRDTSTYLLVNVSHRTSRARRANNSSVDER